MKLFILFSFFLFASCLFGTPQASPYSKKVKKVSSGAVYIRIESEKQHGETCNPTSMSMILDYYGIRASSKDLQKDSNRTEAYKKSKYLKEQLKKYNMQMLYLPVSQKNQTAVFETVKRAIDCGLPLQWLVDLLKAPDYDIPQKHKRKLLKKGPVAGHARIFNGYHLNRKTQKIDYFIFTDSWGIKHRKKEIKTADVCKMTSCFYIIAPESLPTEVIKYIYEPMQKINLNK